MAERILLVEDEPDLRLALSVRLRAAGFHCETANNGKEGLEQAAQRRPDLIIANLFMPVMDGHEMVRHLRADPNTASIPIVVITAFPEHSRDAQAAQLLLLGVRILQRPFEAQGLLTIVRTLLTPPISGGPDHAGTEEDPHRG